MNKRLSVKVSLIAFLLCILCSPGLNAQAAQNKTLEETYTSTNPEETYDFPETTEIDGKEYELTGVTYSIENEVPILEEETITETVTQDVFSENEEIPQSIQKTIDGERRTLTIVDTKYTPKKVKLGEGRISAEVSLQVEGDSSLLPETTPAEYTDPETGITVTLDLPLTNVQEIDGTIEQLALPMTFYAIDAPYFVFGSLQIPNAGSTPSVAGYEDAYLQYLGLSADEYTITGADWNGDAYMQNGELCRDAVCYVDHYIPNYEGIYGGEEITLPEVDGYEAATTYSAVVEVRTGEIEYTMKATATYQEMGLSTAQITLISIGVIVLIIATILILYTLSKSKKRKESKL